MQIKVDEDLPREIAEILRAGGHDAQTVLEQGWGGLRDADVWRRISSEGRWLMTADKGSADARTIAATEQVGVVLLRTPRESRAAYTSLAESLVSSKALDGAVPSVIIVSPAGIRIHRI